MGKKSERTIKKEANAVALLAQSAGITLRTDREARALPYELAPRRYLADAVWIAPDSAARRGVVIEIQGGRFISGKHGNAKGLATDDKKMAWAQLNDFDILFCDYSDIEEIAPILSKMVAKYYDASATSGHSESINPMDI